MTQPRRKPPLGLFEIGVAPSRRVFISVAASVFIGIILLWWGLTASGKVPTIFLPKFTDVWDKMVSLAKDGTLWSDLGESFYRIAVAFFFSTIMAVILGVLAGCYGFAKAVLEPLVDFVRYMPVVAFVPLTVLWVGTNEVQKLLIIWIGTFFQQVLMVMDAVRRVPRDYVSLGRTLGLSDMKILWRIVVPAAAPAMWDATRICLGWAWTWLVLAELVGATAGLGYRIVVGQRFMQTDIIFGYILLLGILGLITDQVMRLAEKWLFKYQRVAR